MLFAGYKMPHPLEHKTVIKIQTRSQSDPQTALNNAFTALIDELSLLEERLQTQLQDYQKMQPNMEY